VLPFVVWLTAAAEFPSPTGFVNDFAHVLDATATTRLETRLRAYQRETTNEIAIALFPSLGGRTIEDLGVRLFEQWRVGTQAKNNGILIVAAIRERRARIEVGYGLEGKVPDAQAGRIVRELIAPRFAQGDYAGGLDAAIDELVRLIGGTAPSPPRVAPSPQLPRGAPPGVNAWAIALILAFLAAVWQGVAAARPRCPRCHSLLRRDVVRRVALMGADRLTVSYACPNCGYRDVKIEHATTGGWIWGGGTGWSSGGFGGGGGGFGGFGGGGSGGGGASGSW
jgi:uncharacterized protein